MDDFILELKKQFIEEAKDLLEKYQDALDGVDSRELSEEEVNTIFRIVHTLKGNSKATGFEEFSSVLHVFENYLVEVRSGDSQVTPLFKDLLLDSIGVFFDVIDLYASDIDGKFDFTDFEDKLNNFSFTEIEGEAVKQVEVNSQNGPVLITKANGSKFQFMLIDDEADMLDVLKSILLQKYDAEIDFFKNGKEAIDAASGKDYDLILTDHNMPTMDGSLFLKLLRMTENTNQTTPVIMITGFKPAVDKDAQVNQDVYYLEKPFEPKRVFYYAACALRD